MKYLHLLSISFLLIAATCTGQPHFILIGPPGCGKGTFSQYLIDQYGYTQICPGDIFRDEINRQTNLGKEIQPIVERGDYLPNELVWKIIQATLINLIETNTPFIIDGFPRSPEAFTCLDAFIKEHQITNIHYILFTAPEDTCIKRMCSRMVCLNCTQVFNTETKPSSIDNVCDNCNAPLAHRKADTEQAGKKRLDHYKEHTYPTIFLAQDAGYSIIEINTDKPIDICYEEYDALVHHGN